MATEKTFSGEQINQQAQRILNSPTFKSSPTLAKFLEFIVAETVHNGGRFIKEYSIATNVLGRSPDFKPHDDAIVRIHAGRLRRALNEYYLIQGINDPIVIRIPKGSYIPQFDADDTKSAGKTRSYDSTESDIKPILAVFPFRTMPQNRDLEQFSLILGEQLSAGFSRFQDISVIGYYSMEMTSKIEENIIEAGKMVSADYIITGSVLFHEQRFRTLITLLNAATGEVMLTKSFDKEMAVPDVVEIQDEIVTSVMGAVGGYCGIIFHEMAKSVFAKGPGRSAIKEAIYNYYRCQHSYSLPHYGIALSSLQRVTNDFPRHAVSWALLGKLYLDGIGLGTASHDDALSKGYECIMQSLKIEPLCQQAWHALSWMRLFAHEKKECKEAARQCIQLNPGNSIMVSGAAFMLICAGYFDEGFPIMEKAVKLNPYYPWWINGGFSFYYLYNRDHADALSWAEKINCGETFWDPLLKCSAQSYLGKWEPAKRNLERLLEMEPGRSRQIRPLISSFLLSDKLNDLIMEGIEKVGFAHLERY